MKNADRLTDYLGERNAYHAALAAMTAARLLAEYTALKNETPRRTRSRHAITVDMNAVIAEYMRRADALEARS